MNWWNGSMNLRSNILYSLLSNSRFKIIFILPIRAVYRTTNKIMQETNTPSLPKLPESTVDIGLNIIR